MRALPLGDRCEISTFPRKKERELNGGAMKKFYRVFWGKELVKIF